MAQYHIYRHGIIFMELDLALAGLLLDMLSKALREFGSGVSYSESRG